MSTEYRRQKLRNEIRKAVHKAIQKGMYTADLGIAMEEMEKLHAEFTQIIKRRAIERVVRNG